MAMNAAGLRESSGFAREMYAVELSSMQFPLTALWYRLQKYPRLLIYAVNVMRDA
jgi:hypothetical protein